MNYEWSEWGPPLLVMLAAGLGGGGIALYLSRDEKQAEAIGARGRAEDLARRHDEALEALAALETQRGHMDPDDYNAERKALLEKGANAMRSLDEEGAVGAPGASPPGVDPIAAGVAELTAALKRGELDELTYARAVAALASSRSSAAAPAMPPSAGPAPIAAGPTHAAPAPPVSPVWQGAIYAIAGAALVGGLLWYAADQAQPRREGASMTGNQDLGTVDNAGRPIQNTQEPPIITQRRQAAEARLAKDANDVEALNELTQLSMQDPAKAWNYNEMARKANPRDPDARMYHAVITAMMGMPDKSEEYFEELLTEMPDHGPGWAWRGLVLLESKQYERAAAALRRSRELGIVDHQLDNALKIAENNGVMPDAPPIAPGSPAPGAQAGISPPAPAPMANTATIASGTIDLDPGRGTFNAKTLFVSVKDPSRPGPPLAAKQLPPGPFPMSFSVTTADVMNMGSTGPMPSTVQLTLRLDDDGNAFTKTPNDPQITVDGLAYGSSGLALTLK